MSNLFINSIIQGGSSVSNEEKVKILDLVSKQINKKIKNLEYKHGVKFKFAKLPESNLDCIPRKIGIQTFAQVEGPYRGQIPIYTTAEIAMPVQVPVQVQVPVSVPYLGIPISSYGFNQAYMGVPGFAISPFGQSTSTLEDRIKKAKETLEIIIKITEKLKNKKCGDIAQTDSVKKYFDCVDLTEPADSDEELQKKIQKILNKT